MYAGSFVTDSAPKCTISRVKIVIMVNLSPSMVSTTNTTLLSASARKHDVHFPVLGVIFRPCGRINVKHRRYFPSVLDENKKIRYNRVGDRS